MQSDSPSRATLIASLTEEPTGELLAGLGPEVEILEVRADLVGDLAGDALRERCGKTLLYTLRSEIEGGAGPTASRDRRLRLQQALDRGFDLIDLEAGRDLSPELLRAVPPERRILSWHGDPSSAEDLEEAFREMARVPARLYKLVPAAEEPAEALAPLQFLGNADRSDVVAFASGAAGFWTRLVAPLLGAPVVYGSASTRPAAPGQPTILTLVRDYGLPALPPATALFGVAGNPVLHSLSPRLHNAGYRHLDLPYLYLPFHGATFGELWLQLVENEVLMDLGLPIEGLSVTTPFKDAAFAVATEASPFAARIGAANTLVRDDTGWFAESTDAAGVGLALLRRGVVLEQATAVVVGAGGAGRAVAAGLSQAGMRVALANRDRARGESVARELGLSFVALEALDPAPFRVAVNATPLGRVEEDPLPFEVARLAPGAVVVDLVYGEAPTALVRASRARGLGAVDGREVLLFQAVGQFERMAACSYPPALIEAWLAEIGATLEGES